MPAAASSAAVAVAREPSPAAPLVIAETKASVKDSRRSTLRAHGHLTTMPDPQARWRAVGARTTTDPLRRSVAARIGSLRVAKLSTRFPRRDLVMLVEAGSLFIHPARRMTASFLIRFAGHGAAYASTIAAAVAPSASSRASLGEGGTA